MNINKELTLDFTNWDLQNMLDEIYAKQCNAIKINLGFAFRLRHVVTEEFKYDYPSSNNQNGYDIREEGFVV